MNINIRGTKMNVKFGYTFSELASYLNNNNKKLICYGMGLVAYSSEELLIKSGISLNVSCFIDSDVKKQGFLREFCGQNIIINSIDYLLNCDLTDKALLLLLESTDAVIKSLENYSKLINLPCFLFPEMNRLYIQQTMLQFNGCFENNQFLNNERATIPKTIHYCWFGNNKMSEILIDCVKSWSECCPDYKIILWNEDNFDVYCNDYVKQAYQAKKFAFVSDFARFDVLYKHGGVYLDTDVKVLKSFDALLYNKAFMSYNEWPLPSSSICGSVAGNEIFRKMRDEPRSIINFINKDGSYNQTISSYYESKILENFGYKKDFIYQTIADVAIYPPCFFPQIGKSGISNTEINDLTIAVHFAGGSWKK
jgi:hypothetical protein